MLGISDWAEGTAVTHMRGCSQKNPRSLSNVETRAPENRDEPSIDRKVQAFGGIVPFVAPAPRNKCRC